LIIGVPKEIKDNEFRVGMTPAGVRVMTEAGHRVIIEAGAGEGSAISDDDFIGAGAEIVESAADVFKKAEIIVKVKEPQASEYCHLRDGLIVFTFFHFAADKALLDAVLKSGVTAVAYETMETRDRRLPVLQPMSEVAGRLSVQFGAEFLTKPRGGSGILLGGVPGVERGRVLVIGAGTVGLNAIKTAVGLGAEVTVMDVDVEKFRHVDDLFGGAVETLMSNSYNIEKAVKTCDMLVGAVHRPGARTPVVVTREMVMKMRKGSVIVDVAVDQGGSIETIRPTTHSNPTYVECGVIHYGVANMPGAVPRTSTHALTNATLPYLLRICNLGLKAAAKGDAAVASGVNAIKGNVTNQALAASFEVEFKAAETIL
jgi:alanine dehydrogenase